MLRTITILFLLIIFNSAAPACFADQYDRPLVSGGANKIAYQDSQRITRNFAGQKSNFEKTRRNEGTIGFTLYPDGSVKWPHRNYRYTSRKDVDDHTFKQTVDALAKSAPLHPAVAASIKRPQRCILFRNFENGNLTLDVGFEEAVVYGTYHYKRNSPPISTTNWIEKNLAKIKLNVTDSQSKESHSSNDISVIWFKVNPSGMIDDWETVPTKLRSGKRLVRSQRVEDELVSSIKRAQPLTCANNADEPNGPIELLLIYDPSAKQNFKLAVINSYGPHVKFIVES